MTWDSALIGPTGRPRPAFSIVERVLGAQARRRAARAAKGAQPPAPGAPAPGAPPA
jgi:hypothetical protein